MLEYFPVYVTENRVIGEHMALFLDVGTTRPDVVNDKYKYNVRSITKKERAKRNAEMQKDLQYAELQKKYSLEPSRETGKALWGYNGCVQRQLL